MNRRHTDFAGTEVDCTVAGLPTVIKFDWEHQPAEPQAGFWTDGYAVDEFQFIRLTRPIFRALRFALDTELTVRVHGHSVVVSCELDDLEFSRGYWRVRSSGLQDALAMYLDDLDRAQLEEQLDARASLREVVG